MTACTYCGRNMVRAGGLDSCPGCGSVRMTGVVHPPGTVQPPARPHRALEDDIRDLISGDWPHIINLPYFDRLVRCFLDGCAELEDERKVNAEERQERLL